MINLLIGLLLGVIIYLLAQFNKADEQNFLDFIVVKENYLTAVLNLLTGLVLLISYQQNPGTLSIVGITEMTFLTAAIIGFLGHVIWNIIIDGFSNRIRTKLGVKKKQ